MAKVKQTEKVLRYMQEFGSITSLQAMQDLGVMRLASRITDLKQSGYDVQSRYIHSKNRYGEPVKYKEYYLRDVREAIPYAKGVQ